MVHPRGGCFPWPVQSLADKLGLPVYYEPVADNEYLEDFYADIKKYSFAMQVGCRRRGPGSRLFSRLTLASISQTLPIILLTRDLEHRCTS